MKIKRILLWIFCLSLIVSLLPAAYAAPENLPDGAGVRRFDGGQRDFLWPVPSCFVLTSCFIDGREHYSLDIDGEMGDPVVASYAGTVLEIDDTCEHNYNKTEECCSSWGNFVLLEHNYTCSDGSSITLYSRYAHLTEVQVAVGDTVTAGQQIGTIGTTGQSNGTHLDYEILYGGTGSSKTYGVDPYINELLILPEEIQAPMGDCCREYVEYVKDFYTLCHHDEYDALGNCTACGEAFNWNETRQNARMGYYTAAADTLAMPTPYAGEAGEPLNTDAPVAVTAAVTNAAGEVWYEVKLSDTQTVYAPEAALTLDSYFSSNMTGELTSLQEGQILSPAPYRLEGTVISTVYPLRSISAYLNGELYATWTGSSEVYQLQLRNTAINRELSFAELTAGDYTLTITATDSTEREAVTVITRHFVIQDETVTPDPGPGPEPGPDPDPDSTPDKITVTFVTAPENTLRTLTPGQTLGKLPEPVQPQEGIYFVGWFTAEVGGQMVTPFTVPTADMTLYPHWDTKTHTLLFGSTKVIVAHGGFLSELPEPVEDGYRFLGWYMENGEKLTTYVTITENLKLTAKWESLNYTVTLNPNGGTIDAADTFTVAFGEPYGKLPTPTREGYIFLGWKLGSRAITETILVQTARDHTLTAVWQDENPSSLLVLPTVAIGLLALAVLVYVIGRRRKDREMWEKE